MTIEFPEVWNILVKEELSICGAIIWKKANLIKHFEKEALEKLQM